MAKKTKEVAAPAAVAEAPAAPANPTPAEKIEKANKDKFVRVFKDGVAVAPVKKVAPQAQCILNTLEAAGEEGLSRKDLCDRLTGVLVTRQPVGRIVSYYQKALVESGAIQMEAAE